MGGLVIPQTVKTSNGQILTIEGQSGAAAGEVPKWNPTTKRAEWGPAGGGAPVDQAVLQSTAGTVKWLSGSLDLAWADVRYGAATTGLPGAGNPVPSWCTTTLSDIFVPAGWYMATMYLDVRWDTLAGAPDAITVYAGGTGVGAVGNSVFAARQQVTATTYGYMVHVHTGPVFMRGTDSWRAEADQTGAGGATTDARTTSRVLWTITKLS